MSTENKDYLATQNEDCRTAENEKNNQEQLESFFNYQKELIKESEASFREAMEEDLVSFWIHHINFDLRSRRILGCFDYNSERLNYGCLRRKLDIKDLKKEELIEIVNFYYAKGYTLNHICDVVISNPDVIVINWNNPRKQNLEDKKYIFNFKIAKFKKFYRYNRKKHNVIVSLLYAMDDFASFFFYNKTYCLNAIKQHKMSVKHNKRITEMHRKYYS